MVNFYSSAKYAIAGLETLDRENLELLPNLKIISRVGIGLDNIDNTKVRINGAWQWMFSQFNTEVSIICQLFEANYNNNIHPTFEELMNKTNGLDSMVFWVF